MKMRIVLASLAVVFALAFTLPVTAQPNGTIYDDGRPQGIVVGGPSIGIDRNGFPNATSDTVDCTQKLGPVASCTPNDLEFWIDVPIGNNFGDHVNWNFASGPNFGVGYNSGSSAIGPSPCISNGTDLQCDIHVLLGGTTSQPAFSWLTLSGMGPGVKWAFSRDPNAPSMAQTCIQQPDGSCGPTLEGITPEAFNVSGPVPEPGSLLLFGSGLLGAVGLLRRRFLP